MTKAVMGEKYVVANLNGLIGHAFHLGDILICLRKPKDGWSEFKRADASHLMQSVSLSELRPHGQIELGAIYD